MPYWIISTEISGRNTAMYKGNEFHIPHGSIIVNIKLDEEKLSITAPLSLFLKRADTLTPSGGRTQFQRHGSGNDLFAG